MKNLDSVEVKSEGDEKRKEEKMCPDGGEHDWVWSGKDVHREQCSKCGVKR